MSPISERISIRCRQQKGQITGDLKQEEVYCQGYLACCPNISSVCFSSSQFQHVNCSSRHHVYSPGRIKQASPFYLERLFPYTPSPTSHWPELCATSNSKKSKEERFCLTYTEPHEVANISAFQLTKKQFHIVQPKSWAPCHPEQNRGSVRKKEGECRQWAGNWQCLLLAPTSHQAKCASCHPWCQLLHCVWEKGLKDTRLRDCRAGMEN